MKSLRNQIQSAFLATLLCVSLVFLNSCQTSENDIVFSSEQLFTKDSNIVLLFLKALGEDPASTKSFAKSTTEDQQCTEFLYPMMFYTYTDDDTEPTAFVVNNDEEFVEFLTDLTSGEQFFIIYDVTLVDIDNNYTIITDYPDLEGILTMLVDACTGDDDGDNNGDDDSDGGDDSDNDDGDHDDIDYEYCGNGNNPNAKVVICHKGQTICISINAIWGHMAHHSEDYFGSCNN